MTCPNCGEDDDRVLETKDHGNRIYRRRECQGCGERWSTNERRIETREVE